jgi:hypothetical protein
MRIFAEWESANLGPPQENEFAAALQKKKPGKKAAGRYSQRVEHNLVSQAHLGVLRRSMDTLPQAES